MVQGEAAARREEIRWKNIMELQRQDAERQRARDEALFKERQERYEREDLLRAEERRVQQERHTELMALLLKR